MRFAIKLLVGGAGAAMVGVWWLFDGISGGPVNDLLGGLIWKGGLLFVVGCAAVVMGYRMMNPDSNSHATGLPVNALYTKRMTIGGIGVEKIYVFARGREATLAEMLTVMGHPGCKIEGGKDAGMKSATEEWNSLANESDADAIRRIARETSEKHPGLNVLAFSWPDTYPTVIAVYVTDSEFPCPFAKPKLIARISQSTAIQSGLPS